MDKRLSSAWWSLRIGIGVVATVAGLDKFFNILADWPGYVSPLFARLLPVSPGTFMYAVGVIEIVVGLAILTRWTRVAAMSLAAFTLAKLSEVREQIPLRKERTERAPGHRPAPVTP